MVDDTERRRSILLTAYNNPDKTQAEIATACDCPPSEVSAVLQRHDGPDEMRDGLRSLNAELGLDESAGLDRPSSSTSESKDVSETRAILTGDETNQSKEVEETGLDAVVEESFAGLFYFVPWTETDDSITLGDALLRLAIFAVFAGAVVWAVLFPPV